MHIGVARPLTAVRHVATKAANWSTARTGSRARLGGVSTLAAVIALDGADKGTVSATATQLKDTFGIGNTDIGILLTVVSIVSALLSVPMGVLTDRISRTRVLTFSISGWSIAMVAGGAAQSYSWLLISRIGLAAVAAAAGPAVASLVGDLFPTEERAKIYGRILAGELVGTGFGLVGSTLVAGLFGWRAAFFWLVPFTIVLAVVLARTREPARDQAEVLRADPRHAAEFQLTEEGDEGDGRDAIRRALDDAGVQPRPELVLERSPEHMSLPAAVRYVLRVPTNRVLIIASALAYFFFAGLRGFAVEYAQDQYSVTKAEASGLMLIIGAGALVGVFVGGRSADGLLKRGVVNARIWVPVVVLLAAPVAIGPALWASELAIALPLLVIGAAMLSAANPAQDAARLDIMQPRLWGRSESIRSVARTALEAVAPVLFGFTSEHIAGGDGAGLQVAFLIFLLSLPAAGLMGLLALRSYPRDVATALASAARVDAAD
jgi:predicted MFS family arabinose efflux permease